MRSIGTVSGGKASLALALGASAMVNAADYMAHRFNNDMGFGVATYHRSGYRVTPKHEAPENTHLRKTPRTDADYAALTKAELKRDRKNYKRLQAQFRSLTQKHPFINLDYEARREVAHAAMS